MALGSNHVHLPAIKPKLVPKRLTVAATAFRKQSPGDRGTKWKDP